MKILNLAYIQDKSYKSHNWVKFFSRTCLFENIISDMILKQATLFWIRPLRFYHFSVMKEPNRLFLHQCLISRLYFDFNFYCLNIIILGQNWGQKLTKSEMNCVNLWPFLCFWRRFLVEWVHQHPFSNLCENWINF